MTKTSWLLQYKINRNVIIGFKLTCAFIAWFKNICIPNENQAITNPLMKGVFHLVHKIFP